MKKLFFILLSIQMLFALEVLEIKKGDVIEDSVQRLEKKYYKVGIENSKNIRVTLTNMTKDIDLYLRTESLSDVRYNTPIEKKVPDIRRNHCYSSNGRGENEECYYRILGPAPGNYDANVYILVYGFEAGSYRLEVKEEVAEKIDKISEKPTRGKVKKGESKQYKIYGKAGQTIEASIFNLTADADIRVKIGKKAGLHGFDCKSINGGTHRDSCSVTLKKDANVFVQVYGYRSANYSITGAVIKNENQEIINKAKEHCLNHNNSTDKVACSVKNSRVHILKYSEEDGDDFLITVSTQDKWSILNKKRVSYLGYSTSSSLHTLKNTELFYIKSTTSRNAYFDFYYLHDNNLKKVVSTSIKTDDFKIDSFKTILNGKKLLIEYHHKTSKDKFTILYDIGNLPKITRL